ncbi:hypothetical protein [Streptomyces sp. NPDC001876]|uniref:hypothetical protein n=1 Tax=Streptomyces sp. NPDC001876 TaxID=3154402 RepID=UPI00332AA8C4
MELALKDFLSVVSLFVVAFLLSLGTVLIGALLVMAYAAVWHSYSGAVPAIGYGDAVFVAGALVLAGLPLGVARKRS